MREHLTLAYLGRRDTHLAEILNTLFDGVYVADWGRRILFWNTGAEAITGYPWQEVHGRWCGENILNHVDASGRCLCQTACPLTQTLESGQPTRMKLYPLHKSGRRVPVETLVAPVRGRRGGVIAAIEVFRDIRRDEEVRMLAEKVQELMSRYVSHDTLESVLAEAAAGTGSEPIVRDLSVLYLDVVGFTPLVEQSPPAEVVETLNSLFALCEVITQEFHGDIDKFIGDAILAVFVDAADAVAAAMRILETLSEFNRRRAGEGKPPVCVRIGINSGPVLQGDVGTRERKDRTVIGDMVNVAARIEKLAAPNGLVITEATRARLADPSGFVFQEEADVKGKSWLVPVFRRA